MTGLRFAHSHLVDYGQSWFWPSSSRARAAGDVAARGVDLGVVSIHLFRLSVVI